MFSSSKIACIAPVEPHCLPNGEFSGEGMISHVRSLFELAGISSLLVDDPADATIILVLEPCIIRDYRTYAMALISHPIVQAYPERCYTYNSFDNPWPILPGVYVSLHRKYADFWMHKGAPHIHFPNKHVNETVSPTLDVEFDKHRLACFRGSQTSSIRRDLTVAAETGRFSDAVSICRRHGTFFANGDDGQRSYCEEIRNHAFSLSPAGHGPSTFRLYESMALGRAPVIIADSWLPPFGVNWGECSVIIPEANIVDIEKILEHEFHRAPELGANARACYEENFSPASAMKFVINSIEKIQRESPHPRGREWRKDWISRAARNTPALPLKRQIIRAARILRSQLFSRIN